MRCVMRLSHLLRVNHLVLFKRGVNVEIKKALDSIEKIVNKMEFESIRIEISTENDTFLLEKTKPKNQAGFILGGRQ